MGKIGIKKRLAIITIGAIASLLFIGSIGIFTAQKLGNNLEKLSDVLLPNMRSLTLIDMYHEGIRGAALEALVGVGIKDIETINKAQKDLQAAKEDVQKQYKEILSTTNNDNFKKLLSKSEQKMQEYIESAENLTKESESFNYIETLKLYPILNKKFHELEEMLDEVGKEFLKINAEEYQVVNKEKEYANWLSIIALVVSLIAGTTLTLLISASLTTALDSITVTLTDGSKQMGTAVHELSEASHALSSSSSEQAAALQETAASIEEITSMVKKSTDHASESEDASKRSREKAERGRQVVEQMTHSMGEINNNNESIMKEINASNQRITEIVHLIQEIGTKTKIINDIVFQTKLLSFNASVEAARAGEHGKGFAVVAEEVGNLANMSGKASQEISTLLEDSVRKVEQIVAETTSNVSSLVKNAKETVEKGVTVASECEQVLRDIVAEASKVSEMTSSIAHAANEQYHGIEEISKAIHELDKATQINVNAAASLANTANDLTGQADRLKDSSGHLEALVHGG